MPVITRDEMVEAIRSQYNKRRLGQIADSDNSMPPRSLYRNVKVIRNDCDIMIDL